MGSLSLVHWVILAGIIVLLFGAGRLSNVMGEFAKGIKAFKAGMRDDEPRAPESLPRGEPSQPVAGQTVGSDRRVG